MKRLTELQYATDFVAEDCIYCFAPFAISKEHYRQRQADHKGFYCPACGKSMVYGGENEDQRQARLAREEAERARREAEDARRRQQRAEEHASTVNRQYKRIRDRVKNGVCPCCTRTFQNLASHMKTEHPHFGNQEMLKSLRETYGMSQSALAEEIGVNQNHISAYENTRPVAAYAYQLIEGWLQEQVA